MRIFLILIFISIFQLSYSQKYFEFTDDKDTASTNFYDKNYKATFTYNLSQPNNYYGISGLLHFNKERFSSYFEFNTNIDNTYTITGSTFEGTSTRQKIVHYTSWTAATGLASAIGTDWVLYISIGVNSQTTRIKNRIADDFLYNLERDYMKLYLGVGAFYILPFNLSLHGGYEITNNALKLGLGWTF